MKTAAGALFVAADTGRVLLNLRAPDKTHGMHWSLWGGMALNGESPPVALRREIFEEMGEVDIHRIYPFDVYESRDREFRYYTFVCVTTTEFVPQMNSESAGFCWCDLGVWPRPLHSGLKNTFANRRGMSLLQIIRDQHQGATNLKG